MSEAKKPSLSIITCHPDSPEVPVLRKSVERNPGLYDTEIVPVVGASSICVAYNQGAKQAHGQYLLFTHSDVELFAARAVLGGAIQLLNKLETGVVGIAGSKLLNLDAIWWQAKDGLSGACMHKDAEGMWTTAFGRYGRVVVLDGVLLLVSRTVFDAVGGFDESIPGWDFYDIDFTLRVHLAGHVNSTFPLHVLHRSLGAVDNKPGWHQNRAAFIEKWRGKLPVAL